MAKRSRYFGHPKALSWARFGAAGEVCGSAGYHSYAERESCCLSQPGRREAIRRLIGAGIARTTLQPYLLWDLKPDRLRFVRQIFGGSLLPGVGRSWKVAQNVRMLHAPILRYLPRPTDTGKYASPK